MLFCARWRLDHSESITLFWLISARSLWVPHAVLSQIMTWSLWGIPAILTDQHLQCESLKMFSAGHKLLMLLSDWSRLDDRCESQIMLCQINTQFLLVNHVVLTDQSIINVIQRWRSVSCVKLALDQWVFRAILNAQQVFILSWSCYSSWSQLDHCESIVLF